MEIRKEARSLARLVFHSTLRAGERGVQKSDIRQIEVVARRAAPFNHQEVSLVRDAIGEGMSALMEIGENFAANLDFGPKGVETWNV